MVCFSSIVVFCTVYALILPAITLERQITEGFDLSATANAEKISEVVLEYKEAGTDVWKELSGEGSPNVIPGDARLRLTVGYQNIDIQMLKAECQSSLTYDLPDLLQNATAEGNIMDEHTTVGHVRVDGGKAILTFEENYLNKLLSESKTSIAGNFYAEGDVDLSQVPDSGSTTITIAGKEYQLNFGENPISHYGQVSVEKQCTSEKLISRDDGEYLSYTVTVTAGKDGSKDVSVVDQFQTNGEYVSYVGISSVRKPLSGEENDLIPYEQMEDGKTHGSIYLGQQPTQEQPVPEEGGATIPAPGSLVWKIDELVPNESRMLTYFVKLDEDKMVSAGKYMNRSGAFNNHVDVYSANYKKNYANASFTPAWSHNLKKEIIEIIDTNGERKGYIRNENGTYTIQYKLSFILNKNGTNFPLKDFEFQDYLNHSANPTNSSALSHIEYEKDSVKVYQKKDGTASDLLLEPSAYTKEWATDGKSFKIKIPEAVNPGDAYFVTYQVKVQPEAMAALKGNGLEVNNRLIVSASNADKSKGTGFEAYSKKQTISYNVWDVKNLGNKTASDQTVSMSGERYELSDSEVLKDSSDIKEFVVPAGSYPYTVDVNTLGDWDMTGVKMTDSLESEYMQYVGYVKVDAYDPKDSVNGGSVNAPKETKWVKIDGKNSFALCPSDLGWKNTAYAYRFTYYAQPVNTDAFSEISVNNTFTLAGNAIRGGQKFDITGMRSQRSVTISGNYSMKIKKTAWYYEEPSSGESTWEKGRIYWVIEVDGTSIKKDMQIKDEIQQKTGITLSYLHSDSLAGIYQGTLPAENGITGYRSLEEFKAVEGMQNITSKFTTKFTNDKNFKGQDQYSELIVTAKEQILLNGEKIYLVICSEPEALPASGRDSMEYQNGVSTSDNGASWMERDAANKVICADGDILKELGQTFLYDGSTLTNLEKGKDNADQSKIVTTQLPGAGLYASWAFKVNYGGELSGRYRVLEQIPDGMELAYIRVKWTGTKQKINSYPITDLSEGWQERTITAKTDNESNETTISYVKGQEALIELGEFIAGNEKDSYAVDVQVVCRVTDKDVLLGGAKKTFTNQVVLQTTDGQEISTASSPATMEMKNLSKEGQTDKEKVLFTIQANQLGQRLPTEEGMTKLKLIDKLSSTLILDTSTIKAVKTGTETEVPIVASLGSNNTLEIELPCAETVTITYTATVNAPPGQKVSFSNNAYWEGYSSSGGDGVKQDGYTYAAGGTVSAGDNIRLKIVKKDQNNLALGLAGAEFEMVRCTLDTQKNEITEDSGIAKWKGTTDENGILNFGSGNSDDPVMSYNTIYKVTETKPSDGYMLDQEPFYIMVPKIEKKSSDYSEYVKQCIADSRISVQYQSTYELTVRNHKGEIIVEKHFQNVGGKKSNPVSGTYWFALYDNAEGNGEPLQKISITYRAESTGVQSARFTDLDLTAKYYVFELNDAGQPITDTTKVSSVGGLEYFASYSTKKVDGSVSNGNEAVSGETVRVTNQSRVQELPSTGSCGVWIYRISGGILLILAGILALYHRKKQK